MNSFETISFSEVRDRAKAKLRELNSTMQDMYIDLSILDANRRILSSENVCQKETLPLEVCDYCVDLPCDFKEMILLTTSPIDDNTSPMVYSDYPFDAPSGVVLKSFPKSFLLEQGKLKFPSNFDADKVIIFYNAFTTDADGFPVLKLSHVDYYVWSAVQEMYESKGDYKSAGYWESKKARNKKALILNEQATQFELDKVNLRRRIYSVFSANNFGSLAWRGLWQ